MVYRARDGILYNRKETRSQYAARRSRGFGTPIYRQSSTGRLEPIDGDILATIERPPQTQGEKLAAGIVVVGIVFIGFCVGFFRL